MACEPSANLNTIGAGLVMDPSVSVIIPCYRQSDLLARAIESCLNQSAPPLEILVVDDGGDPEVNAVAQKYGKAVRLLRQAHGGLSRARNTGLAAARGRFAKFLDADDWLLPEALERQSCSLLNLPEDYIAISGHRAHYAEEPERESVHYPDYGPLERALMFCSPTPIHAYLFSTSLIRSVDGFSVESFLLDGNEDYELLSRLVLRGIHSITIWEPCCVYWRHRKSMSARCDAIARSRNIVWCRFAAALLNRALPPGILADLLAGYARLVSSSNLGFDCADIVDDIASRLSQAAVLTPGVVATAHACARLVESRLLQDPHCQIPAAARIRAAVRTLTHCSATTDAVEENSADHEPSPLAREFTLNVAGHQAQQWFQSELDLASEKVEDAETNSVLCSALYKLVALRLLPTVKEVIVYGSGRAGSVLLPICRECGIRVVGLTDSDRSRWGKSVDGIPVLPPEQCLRFGCNDWVIASLAFVKDIESSIIALGHAAGRELRIFQAL